MKVRKIFILLSISVVLALWFTGSASAYTIWANGVSGTSGWYDAEKRSADTDDDYLCWAATASNILLWSGWNAGYANEDNIFTFMQDEDPIDTGGWMDYAWKFWFDGSEFGEHFKNSTHTGYYSTAEFTASYSEEMDGGSDVMSDISTLLQNDWGVGLAVRGNMDHAVTLWGVEYILDDTTQQTVYTGVYLSDSDNNKSGANENIDTLDYYDVTLSGSTWHLEDFYGSDANYIWEWQALKEAASVPEPSSLLLLLSGLLGLGALRRRMSRKS